MGRVGQRSHQFGVMVGGRFGRRGGDVQCDLKHDLARLQPRPNKFSPALGVL
ncbi:MAG: hypothetical protein HND48_12625 [Chloroflexi bacterium]|nr:hypothetical protein [Chloroflexota bacterium]